MVNFEQEVKRLAGEVLADAKLAVKAVEVVAAKDFEALVARVEALEAKIEAAAKVEGIKVETEAKTQASKVVTTVEHLVAEAAVAVETEVKKL